MDDEPSTLGPDVRAALDTLDRLRRDVLSDQLAFNRRKRQLAGMLADCAAIESDCVTIRAALDEDQTQRLA